MPFFRSSPIRFPLPFLPSPFPPSLPSLTSQAFPPHPVCNSQAEIGDNLHHPTVADSQQGGRAEGSSYHGGGRERGPERGREGGREARVRQLHHKPEQAHTRIPTLSCAGISLKYSPLPSPSSPDLLRRRRRRSSPDKASWWSCRNAWMCSSRPRSSGVKFEP